MESIITLTWSVIALLLIVFVLIFNNNNNTLIEPDENIALGVMIVEEPNSNLAKGKSLFKSNCATCHNKNMKDDLTGPALAGVTERWMAFPKEDLYNWIRNSQKLINEKHPKAMEVGKEWGFVAMTSFPNLSNEDIEAILLYVER